MSLGKSINPKSIYPDKPENCTFGGFTSVQLADELGVSDTKVMDRILWNAKKGGIAWKPYGKFYWFVDLPALKDLVKAKLRVIKRFEAESSEPESSPKLKRISKYAIEKAWPSDIETICVIASRQRLTGLIDKIFGKTECDNRQTFIRNVKRLKKIKPGHGLFIDIEGDKYWVYEEDEKELKRKGVRGKHRTD